MFISLTLRWIRFKNVIFILAMQRNEKMSSNCASPVTPVGLIGKKRSRNPIQITPELEEVMKRVSDLKNVAGMVVVNSEGETTSI